jgi:hypothetical protein
MGGMRRNTAGQAGPPVFDSYARLSWTPSTRELEKIDTQHADNNATIRRHGGRDCASTTACRRGSATFGALASSTS